MSLFRRELQLIAGGRDVSGLRVAFRVSKSLGPKLNTSEIAIWNLSRETAAAAAAKGAKVMLSAGYRGEVRLLFVGDMDQVTSEIQGPDRITRLRAGDGLAAARLQRQFDALASGLNVGNVIEHLAGQARIAAGDAISKLKEEGMGAAAGDFVNGIVTAGPVQDQLAKFAESLDVTATIRDEALLLLREGQSDGEEAVVLAPNSGMIGSPVMGREKTSTGAERDVLRVRSLLNGDLQPGRALRLEGEMLSGWFVVHAVTHVGDTHAGDWYSDVEAMPA